MRKAVESTVDINHAPKRAEDFSTVTRIASLAMRWQWLLWLFFATMIAVGFDFKTPSQKFAEVAGEAIKNRNAMEYRINGVERRMNEQDERMQRALNILEGLAIDACDRLRGNKYARQQLKCEGR